MRYDVAIAGAGVIGAMLARELCRYRLSVCVLEKENDVAMGASKANSGIIHGGFDPVPGTLKAKMNAEGLPLLYRAAEELGVPHRRCGSIVVAFGPEEEPAIDELHARGLANGAAETRILTGDEARTLEPRLSPEVTRALLVPDAGVVCPYALTIAAMGNAMDNGAALLRNFEITAVTRGEDGFTVAAADGRRVQARFFANCAGAFADRIAEMVGDAFYHMIPRAGEYLLLDKEEGNTVSRTVFQVPTKNGKGVLVTPTADGNLLIGPTASPVGDGEDVATTAEGLEKVVALARRSVPTVNVRAVITSFSGVRASEKGGDFIIRMSEKVPGFLHVAAIDSPGLSSAAAIAKYAVERLAEAGLPTEPNPGFDPTRPDMHAFRNASPEERDALIAADPAYGRIVCRCEGVSEGEILAAIRLEPRALDVDGVKRRTRAGMGRCQGGFCAPYVMGLIAKELGVPPETVTKKGPGSEMAPVRL